MTKTDFTLLQSPDTKAVIERYLNTNSVTAALKIGSAPICSQIKYLARAAKKLPHYFDARCIISDILYEQCSSEVAAYSKFSDSTGDIAIDLTCGLGVDSFAMSKKFKRVISIEADALKAEIATYNFSLLGAENIDVVNTTAEAFCSSNQSQVDLIYVDPSRVTPDGRVFAIEESSPNIIDLLPTLVKISPKIIIKLSPMFDTDECFKIFGNDIAIEAVSVNNECKEVLVKIGFTEKNTITNTILRADSTKRYTFERGVSPKILAADSTLTADFEPTYIHIADVTFYKTRTINSYISAYYPKEKIQHENYIFSTAPLPDFAGQSFKIEHWQPYQPKSIKKLGIKRATVHLRNFPHTLGQVMRDLAITEGGKSHIILTIYNGKPTFFLTTAYNEKL